MRTIWEDVVSDIRHRENIDVYALFVISVIVGIFGIVTVSSVLLSVVILAAVNVLAYSALATRRMLGERASASLKDRNEFRPLWQDLNGSNVIWLCGPSLVVMFTTYKGDFHMKIRHGGKVRALIFNPQSKNLPMLAESLGVSQNEIRAEIQTTIEACKGLVKSGLGVGELDVRQTEMLTGDSLVIFDPLEHSGQMSVEFIGYHTGIQERPHIELKASNDRRWFTFFLSQFNEIWESASPVDLSI